MVEPMLEKLFGARRRAAAPEGLRLYAIGDIHGCADALNALLRRIEAEPAGEAAKQLIFLGDYVDRGPDSRGVVDALVSTSFARAPVFLKGNHEAAMLDFLRDPNANEAWLGWGGADTLRSYGIDEIGVRDPEALAGDFLQRLPGSHRAFFEALERWRIFGDYLFVHAGLRPGRTLEEQEDRDLFWIREPFHNAQAGERPDHVVVHGHHPVRKPVDSGWRIDVDTGACYGGALTAVVLEGTSRRFISV